MHRAQSLIGLHQSRGGAFIRFALGSAFLAVVLKAAQIGTSNYGPSIDAASTDVTTEAPSGRTLVPCGQIGGAMSFALDVAGRYAYLGQGLDLLALDVSNPMSPTRVARLKLPHAARDIAVSGDFVLVAAHEAGLLVVDGADPVEMRVVGRLDLGAPVTVVAVAAGLAYIGTADDMAVVDITTPSLPVLRGKVAMDWPDTDHVEKIAVVGTMAYILSGWGRLVVLDVAQANDPRRVGELADRASAGRAWGSRHRRKLCLRCA